MALSPSNASRSPIEKVNRNKDFHMGDPVGFVDNTIDDEDEEERRERERWEAERAEVDRKYAERRENQLRKKAGLNIPNTSSQPQSQAASDIRVEKDRHSVNPSKEAALLSLQSRARKDDDSGHVRKLLLGAGRQSEDFNLLEDDDTYAHSMLGQKSPTHQDADFRRNVGDGQHKAKGGLSAAGAGHGLGHGHGHVAGSRREAMTEFLQRTAGLLSDHKLAIAEMVEVKCIRLAFFVMYYFDSVIY